MKGVGSLPAQLPPYYSLALAVLVTGLDYVVGPKIEFPALFIIPIAYAAWYGGRAWALPLCLLPFAHIGTLEMHDATSGMYEALISATVRAVMLVPIAWWIASVAASQRALTQEVAMLEGLLPICSYCKKIRDDDGDWQMLEKYIQDRTAATFTHGVCESCLNEQLAMPVPRRRSG
ncbi:MAG: hypothetical protein M3Q55_01255 [Acidobacteriota bacterium]|nr:hypothetical protein [Acidobacteriota bacterium]